MEITKFVQFVQIAIVISCCVATFIKPSPLAAFRPPMLLKPFYKPTIYKFPMKPLFRQPHPPMFPSMIKQPFNVIPVLKPKLFMKPIQFSKAMIPMMIQKVKYMKVPKIPFRYLRPKSPPKYKLPTPVFRGNVVTGYRPPPSINRPRPRVRRPPTRIYRRPLSRPPTRIYRRPLSRPRPRYPNRSYIPPPESQPPITYRPPTQPPVVYNRPPVQPPVSDIRPQVQPPVVYDILPVRRPVPNNGPHVPMPVVNERPPVQPTVSDIRPHVQPPVVNDRTAVQPSVPNRRSQSIPEQRRIQWLQTAHGGINFAADDDDDEDDFYDYWEGRFNEFDDSIEDLLKKKTDGYYDNDGDNMLDDEIYENFDTMNVVRTNIARSRKHLGDLIENGGRANRLTQQTTQPFQPGNTQFQQSKTNEGRFERQNKYQEKYFENQGNRMMQRGQQNQPLNISAQPSLITGDIVERQNNYQEKYFESINSNENRFNNRAQQFPGSNVPIPTSNHLGNRDIGTTKYSEKYFERNGNSFSQQNNQQDITRSHQINTNGDRLAQQAHQFPGFNMPVQGTNGMENYAGGRNEYVDKYFERNGNHLPQQNSKQDILLPQQSSTNNDLLIQQTLQFPVSNMPDQATKNLENFAVGRNRYDDKYFERSQDNLAEQTFLSKQRPQQINTDGDLKMQNNEKIFDRIRNRRMQQLHPLQIQRKNRRTGNGIENTLVTRQLTNFADNTGNVQREQIIKYQNNDNRYLENKDEFRRRHVQTLTETQKQFDIQRENHLFQRSPTIPRAKTFPSLKS